MGHCEGMVVGLIASGSPSGKEGALLQGRTAIVIAHRLATIRGADRIIVLQAGEVIENGDHDTLMASGGHYSQLYSLNFASFDDA